MKYLDPQPWQHQLKAIALARQLPNLALFFEMGTGKTRTAIEIIREHCARANRLMRVLILCPVIVVKNWKEEFEKYSKIEPFNVRCLMGAGSKRAEEFQKLATDPVMRTLTGNRIFITNYEAMEMGALVQLILDWKPEILVCDESHRLKNPQGYRARIVTQIADLASHKYILTGTPILNSALDIYNQYRILDGGETFSVIDPITRKLRPMNFYEFRGSYFEDLNLGMPTQKYFPNWNPRQETYQVLNQKIYRKAIRVLKTECLDLPPLVKEKIEISLGTEQKRIYQQMKNEYVAWVESKQNEPKAVVAQLALTKALRLQQIVSGYAKTDDGEEVFIKENPRAQALSEILSDLTPSHKVIVWATFRANYRQIIEVCQKLKISYVELHGDVPQAVRQENLERFRTKAHYRVMIANQGAAGIGINLVEASYSIFYSRNFSLEHDLQAESRNYRGGSEIHERITRIDLVAPGTIDEMVLDALAKKQSISDQILDWKMSL